MDSLLLKKMTSVILAVMITFNAVIVESESRNELSSRSLVTSPRPPVSTPATRTSPSAPPPPPSSPPSPLSPLPPPPPPRRKPAPPPPPPRRRSTGNGHKRSRRHLPPPPPPSVHNHKMNTGKKVGLLFVGIATILQIGVVGFLVFKRRQLLKMHHDTCS